MHGHLQSNENTRSRRFRQMNLTIHDKKRGMKRNEKQETSSFDISTFVPRISNYNKLDSLDIVSTRSKNSSFLEGHGN